MGLRRTGVSLRSLLVGTVLVASVPAALLMVWHASRQVAAQTRQLHQELATTADMLAQQLSRELHLSADTLRGLAPAGGTALDMQALPASLPFWRGAFVLDARGALLGAQPVDAALPLPTGLDARRDWVLGPVSGSPGQPGVHALAVSLDGGARWFGGWIETRRWSDLLRAATGEPARHLSLYDADRRRVAAAGAGPAAGLLPAAAASGGRVVLDDGAEYDIALRAVPGTAWQVAVELPAAVLDARHRRVVAGTLGWAIVSLLLGAGLALWAASRVVGPLRSIGAAGAADKGRLAVREIEQLRAALAQADQREAGARAGLQRKADELEAVFQASPVGLALAQNLPGGGVEVSANPAWTRLLGEQGSDGACRLRDGGRPLPAPEQPLLRAASSGEVVAPTVLDAGDAALPRHVVMQAVPLHHGDGTPRGAIAVAVDVTEQYRAERERVEMSEREQQARSDAHAANRAKDELLSMLSHELRNPLHAIATALEVLGLRDDGDAVQRDARNTIARQTRRLTRMLGELLTTAAALSGEIVLRRSPVELRRSVASAIDGARRIADEEALPAPVAGAADAGESADAAPGAPAAPRIELQGDEVWVDADPALIEQMAAQLIVNALKHSPPDGEVRVVVRGEERLAVIEVHDRGAGISAALLASMFDPFVQRPQQSARSGGGLGLGLTLVRQIAQMHGGKVRAWSSAQGSVFRVELPRIEAPARLAAAAPSGANAAPQAAPPVAARRASPRDVLLVEDNPDSLRALRTALEFDGHRVSAACDGSSGLRALLDRPPEVAIVDIGLPGLDGLQLARLGRGAGYAGRLVALSGYGRESHVQQAMRAGFDAHLPKPVDFARLREVLATLF